jgi:predicted lysophospholipase L1 biosynthesis ABC-type transport system permease subunit
MTGVKHRQGKVSEMTVRSTALALTAAAIAATSAAAAGHRTAVAGDAWRFMGRYRTLVACRDAGRPYIARHRASSYTCENDYVRGGRPVIDLYVR